MSNLNEALVLIFNMQVLHVLELIPPTAQSACGAYRSWADIYRVQSMTRASGSEVTPLKISHESSATDAMETVITHKVYES